MHAARRQPASQPHQDSSHKPTTTRYDHAPIHYRPGVCHEDQQHQRSPLHTGVRNPPCACDWRRGGRALAVCGPYGRWPTEESLCDEYSGRVNRYNEHWPQYCHTRNINISLVSRARNFFPYRNDKRRVRNRNDCEAAAAARGAGGRARSERALRCAAAAAVAAALGACDACTHGCAWDGMAPVHAA
jgi:hypothetical protein